MTREEELTFRTAALEFALRVLPIDYCHLTVNLASQFYRWIEAGKIPTKDEADYFKTLLESAAIKFTD